jgi:pantothenate synthetase
MSEDDLDFFLDPRDLDSAREILRRHGVYQFFFPAPDQLLLGAIDRHATISRGQHLSEIAQTLGHPAGEMELVPTGTKLTELIDALKERKLLVERRSLR